MKTKCNLDSEMQTATVRAKCRVAMKRTHEFNTEEQTATVRGKSRVAMKKKH